MIPAGMAISPNMAYHPPHRPMLSPSRDDDRPSTRGSNDGVHSRSKSTANSSSPKRLSVFSGRSRSNTTTSTSSYQSPASSMTSSDSATVPSTYDERAPSAAAVRSERLESVTKSLLSRGTRMLRRQGSKVNISATLDEEDESGRGASPDLPHSFSFRSRAKQNSHNDQLKGIISDPFDFHHLTHTSPSQFQTLDRARETDLVTEFSAIRASQRPGPELKGIRAQELHFQNFSAENLATSYPTSPDEEPIAISSPDASPSAPIPSSPKSEAKAKRESRNFSRPGSWYPKQPARNPLPSPPLADLAEPAPRAIDEVLGLPSQQTYPEHVYSNTEDAGHNPPLSQFYLAGMFPPAHDPVSPDNGANTRPSSAFNIHPSELADVPEEEETANGHEGSEPYRAIRKSSVLSGGSAEVPFAGPSGLAIQVPDDLTRKFSDVLGSPTLPQFRLGQQHPAQTEDSGRRRSRSSRMILPDIYESWDADIDYCYEHAAESNSNFDWSRNSFDESRRPATSVPIVTPATPDEDPASDHAAESTARAENELRQVNSSMFPLATEKQMPQESFYDEYLAADGESDRHFPFCSPGAIHPLEQSFSPRSSFSPISKCNSQESLMLSRAGSIVRKHRSSVSTTSVPDLVHSLSGSREHMPTDQVPSNEQLQPSTSSGPAFPHHRQAKSLAREIEAHVMQKCSNSSLDQASSASASPSPAHDRAKSAPAVEEPISTRTTRAECPSAKARKSNHKKGRASYSLFPSTPSTAAHF